VNGDPLRLPIPISDLAGGMYGAVGTLNALYAREKTGKGQLVDVSLFESALSFSPYEVSGYFATGQRPKRIGATHRNAAPYQNYRTEDGWLALGAATQVLWLKFCDTVIHAPELAKDPRFETNALRIQNNAALSEIVTQYLAKETTEHWLDLLEKAGIPAAPVLSYDEVLNNPHFLARDQVESVDHPVAGPTKLLRTPVKFSETPVSIRRPAPTLGQHTDELLAELDGKKRATR
jgi:crotonobetainyl-CoA:carnitine CoA-transferase CaiB-like acyl-CoA transferase